jgi:hypothetical protein
MSEETEVEKLDECPECEGTGVVYLDEDDGEGHSARGVISEPCLCQRKVKIEQDIDD